MFKVETKSFDDKYFKRFFYLNPPFIPVMSAGGYLYIKLLLTYLRMYEIG
jgi:hypothetical protein